MQSVLKTLLALALALGFLVLDIPAKTTVAFLGIDPRTDPLFGKVLSASIHRELGADSALASLPPKLVEAFLAKAGMEGVEAGPEDIRLLKRGLDAGYYAYGWLEPLTVVNKRTWWKFWAVRTTWSQGLRLRVLDGATGEVAFDGRVPAEIPEKHFLKGPDPDRSGGDALERDADYRRMLPYLSLETAKALAKVVAGRTAGGREGGDAGTAAEPVPGPGQ